MQRLQADAVGEIQRAEFLAMCADMGGEKTREFFEELFQKSDLDSDGRVTEAEQEYMTFLASESLSMEAPAEDGRLVRDDVGLDFFRELDKNGDGVLDLGEVVTFLRHGIDFKDYDKKVQRRFLSWSKEAYERADVDLDGTLSAEEATFIMFLLRDALRKSVLDNMKILEFLFEHMDKDEDGRISIMELQDTLQEAKQRGLSLVPLYEKILQHFEEADADYNRLLDEREIMKLAWQRLADKEF